MPDLENMTPGQILADASVADFIKSLGLAIAEAQTALDANSVNQIPEFVKPIPSMGGKSLLDLGLSPAFYHYQHADLTCSLQLSLKVGTNLTVGVGLNGSYGSGGTSTTSQDKGTSGTESGTSTSTTEKSAQLTVASGSTGTLSVGGKSFTLTGADPLTRIRGLQTALTSDAGAGVPRALYQAPADTFTISTDAPAGLVVTTGNTVAFTGGGFARGFIRIDTNAATSYTLNTTTTVTTAAQADLDAYATHVASTIQAAGFTATANFTANPLTRVFFKTGRQDIEQFTAEGKDRNPRIRENFEAIAQLSKIMNLKVTVQGHTDTQAYPGGAAVSDASNRQLGDLRANGVRNALISYGAPPANVTLIASTGAADARAAGGPADQVQWRNAEIRLDPAIRIVYVQATAANQTLDAVSPANLTAPAGTGNAWFYLFKPQSIDLSGKKVTIDGTDFALSGSAAAAAASGTPDAYAANLASLVNTNTAAPFTGSADGNVVTLYKKTSPFTLTLYSAESRQLNLQGSETVKVTRDFSSTTTASSSQKQTGNSTVAFGATVDVRYGRQFDTTVTGNSSITARLVSIPAPPQFLDAIREYLNPKP